MREKSPDALAGYPLTQFNAALELYLDNFKSKKPCPFCGCPDNKVLPWTTDTGYEGEENTVGEYSVFCKNRDCNSNGPTALTEIGAIELWENR
jgi:hypothetical protein